MKLKPWVLIFLLIGIFSSCSRENEKPEPKIADKGPDLSTLKAEFPFRGKIIFQSDLDGDNEIYLLTEMSLRKLTDNSWSDEYPKWSPDGKKIAFTANPRGNYDVFVMNEDGTGITQITDFPKDEIEHAWFPDGKTIAYTERVKRGFRRSFTLFKMDLQTGKPEKIIPDFPGSNALPDFSPIAPLMAFTGKRMIGWDVFIYDFEKKKYWSLTEGGGSCRPRFSRDGEKIAYVSAEADGKGDIWLMNPDGSQKLRITERNETYDYFPSWSADGKYIVFCSDVQHSLDKGHWALHLVRVNTKTVIPLLKSPGKDLFPDWY